MPDAGIAQSVEHFTRNEGVVGSSPISSFLLYYGKLFCVYEVIGNDLTGYMSERYLCASLFYFDKNLIFCRIM